MLMVNVEVRLCQIISFQYKNKLTKNDLQNPLLTSFACCVFASGAHLTNLLNESGKTCAQ